jgi:MscS family membrane protein
VRRPASGVVLALTLGIAGSLPAVAQDTTAAVDTTAPSPVVVSPESPRAAIEAYLTIAREGRFEEAARYLDIPPELQADGGRLARHLKAVLDRHLWVDLEGVSPDAVGDTTDALPPGVDQVGVIRDADSAARPVRLTRTVSGDPAWQFSRATVDLIPVWYATLGDRWILENLPAPLLRPGPLDLLWWQWAALPIIILIALVGGKLVGSAIQAVAIRLAARTSVTWDDVVIGRISGPLSAALALAIVAALLPFIGLYPPAASAAYRVVRAGYFIVFFWSIFRLVDIAFHLLAATPWALASPTSRALLPLGSRVAKVAVFAIATVAVLSLLGYPVASLVAGLGIGGLALALAAQKTVENLFGAFSIGVDQPFRVGDFVKIQDFVGTVEAIGLRSTRFRTLDRTLVTIPNGQLADSRLESLTARDRMRLHAIIGVVYETTEAQMREVLAGFEKVLRDHPKIWPDAMVVRFREFAASSLDIEVMAWFETQVFSEFQLYRQEVLLGFMGVVERAGSSIAFPTRTVHLVGSDPRREPEPADIR